MFFFLAPFEISVWLTIIGLILVIAFFTTFFSKFSPFGAYGRKIHAMQSCSCTSCALRREKKLAKKCRFVDTKTYDCLVEKVEEDDDLNELSYYNSAWLVGTGTCAYLNVSFYQMFIVSFLSFVHKLLLYASGKMVVIYIKSRVC